MRLLRVIAATAIVAVITAAPLAASAADGQFYFALVQHPGELTDSTTVEFAYETDDPGEVTCSLDGAPFTPCGSPISFSDLASGSHNIAFRSPNTGGSQHNWVVDAEAPVVSFGTVEEYYDHVPAVPFSAVDLTSYTFYCQDTVVDDRGWLTSGGELCSPPYTPFWSFNGVHTLDVTATDQFSHSSTESVSFSVDTYAPTVTLVDTPPATSPSTVSFGFTTADDAYEYVSSGVASTECAIDDAAPAACASGDEFGSLASGGHEFSVWAIDRAGNRSEPATYEWTVDATAPDLSLGSVAPYLSSAPATLAFTVEGATAVSCTEQVVAGGVESTTATSACESPLALSAQEGSHTITVTALNAIGNSTSRTVTYIVDSAPPQVLMTAGPQSITSATDAVFQFSVQDGGDAAPQVSGVDTVTCTLDGAPLPACGGDIHVSALTDGQHTFTVVASDRAGNATPALSRTWTVDATAPVVSIVSAPSGVTSSTSALVSFTATDATTGVATLECTVDSTPVACTDSVTLAGLADGSHSVWIHAVDGAGNSTEAGASWTVDTVPPVTVFDSGPGAVSGATATFEFSAVDGSTPVAGLGAIERSAFAASGLAFECSVDGDEFDWCTSPVTLVDLAAGEHMFAVRAVDVAGNVGSPTSYEWSVVLPPVTGDPAIPPAQPQLAATGGSIAPALWGGALLLGLGASLLVARPRRRAVSGANTRR